MPCAGSHPYSVPGRDVAREHPGQPAPAAAEVEHPRGVERHGAVGRVAVAQPAVERDALRGERRARGAVPRRLQRRVRHRGQQRADVRPAVVLLREEQRPDVGVERAEAREVLGAAVRARRVDRAQLVARGQLEPFVVPRRRGRGRGAARAQRADPGGHRPQRSSDRHRAAGYPHARFGGRPPRPARRAAPGGARRRRRDRRLRVRDVLGARRGDRGARARRRRRGPAGHGPRDAAPRHAARARRPGELRERVLGPRPDRAARGPGPARARPARPARRRRGGRRARLGSIPLAEPVAAGLGSRARRRDLHGDLRAARRAARPPARLDPRPDASRTGSASSPTTARRPSGSPSCERLVAGDPRFVVSRSPRRLGFYRNFERALALAPAGARHVALADQDDVWHPDKLAVLLGGARGRASSCTATRASSARTARRSRRRTGSGARTTTTT